jgi:hypothetical protein
MRVKHPLNWSNMARFTVRVELHDGQNGEGREAMNDGMAAQGFTRLIRMLRGRPYLLPTAEYRIIGKYTRAQVCRLAKTGLASAAAKAAILVTQGPCSWLNLRPSVD